MRQGIRNGTGILGLLREFRSEAFTGTLDVRDPNLHIRIHLVTGSVIFVQTDEPRHSFPASLLKSGSVSKELLRNALAHAADQMTSLNQTLVTSGAMGASDLKNELRIHCHALLARCYAFTSAEWVARNQTPPERSLVNLQLSPERAFFQAMVALDPSHHQGAIEKCMTLPLKPTHLFKSHGKELMEALGSRGADPVIGSLARPGATLQQLMTKHDPEALAVRAHTLIAAGMLAPEDDATTLWGEIAGEVGYSPESNPAVPEPAAPEVAASPPPPRAPAEPRAEAPVADAPPAPEVPVPITPSDPFNIPLERAEKEVTPPPEAKPAPEVVTPGQFGTGVDGNLIETAYRIQSQSYYQLFGLDPDAPISSILEASRLLKTRHSEEAHAGTMLGADAQKALGFIRRRIDKAKEVLLKPESREAYHAHVGLEVEMRASIALLDESHQLRLEGATAMREDRPLDGQKLYTRALDLVAHDGALHADLAWSLVVGVWANEATPPDVRENTLVTVWRHLDEALILEPRQLHVLRLAGRISRMQGEDSKSLGYFQRALGVDSRDTEAREAVRDYRKQGVTASDGSGGGAEEMLGKLSGFFKKKG